MDERQFGEMVRQYERLVYTICYQFTHDHHTAEDLAQDTFLSAYTHSASCPMDNMKPWLARIAANKAKDHLKSAYNRRVQAADDEGMQQGGTVLFVKEELPEALALSRETTEAIAADIRALKEPYHQVAVLYFLEEQPVETIATRLDRPPKTVHTQLWRARRLLQEKIRGGSGDGV